MQNKVLGETEELQKKKRGQDENMEKKQEKAEIGEGRQS
jgi:hypothetical protein